MRMKLRTAKIVSFIFILTISFNMVACGGKNTTVGELLTETPPPLNNQTTDPDTTNLSPEGKGVQIIFGVAPFEGNSNKFDFISALRIKFLDNWNGDTSLTATDITQATMYINGTPNPITITKVYIDDVEEELPGDFERFGYVVLFDEIFIEYPTTYSISMIVKGVEITSDEIQSLVVNADRTFEILPPQIAPSTTSFANTPTDQNTPKTHDVTLAVANQGREYIFHIIVPNLKENIASGNYDTVHIELGDSGYNAFIYLQRELEQQKFTFAPSPSGIIYNFINIEDNDIIVSFMLPENIPINWTSINNIVVWLSGRNYQFLTADVTVPIEQILPITKLNELRNNYETTSLNAKDNGNGTMTFIYRDTSIKPNYIVPWDWVEIAGSGQNIRLYCNWWIGGLTAAGDNAISSQITLERYLKYSPTSIEGSNEPSLFKKMTLNIQEEIISAYNNPLNPNDDRLPSNLIVEVNESGLTMTWTQNYRNGFNFDNIAGFEIKVWFTLHAGGHSFYDYDYTVRLPISDVIN